MKQQLKEILIGMGILETAITDHAYLVYDLGLDSLDLTEFIMQVEDKFKISIPDSAQEEIRTVSDLLTYLEENASVTMAV